MLRERSAVAAVEITTETRVRGGSHVIAGLLVVTGEEGEHGLFVPCVGRVDT